MSRPKRDIVIKFRVNPEERAMIEAKMAQLGTENMAAYLRKIAIDGYIVKLDLPEVRELVSLMGRIASNINQIARRVNATGRAYVTDLNEIKENQAQLWQGIRAVLSAFAAIH